MSTKELAGRIGTRGLLAVDGLNFPVKVTDAREVFGRVDLLVTPVGGSGERWVAETSVVAAWRAPELIECRYPVIPAVSIRLERAEGPLPMPAPIELRDGDDANVWVRARAVLRSWSWTAPKDGGYDKCDFLITYVDGETYEGRYDLTYESRCDLAEHLWSVNRGVLRLMANGDREDLYEMAAFPERYELGRLS